MQDRACISLSDSNWVSLVSPPVFLSFLTVDLEHVFDSDSLEYLEALECVTERLENRVNYCKAHLMMITCFDISSRRRWRINLNNLLDYCQTPLSFFLNLYPKDPEWGWRLVSCFDYVWEDGFFLIMPNICWKSKTLKIRMWILQAWKSTLRNLKDMFVHRNRCRSDLPPSPQPINNWRGRKKQV